MRHLTEALVERSGREKAVQEMAGILRNSQKTLAVGSRAGSEWG